MCGIAGLVNFNGTSVSSCVLEKMTTAIAHRGPDGEGIWIDRNVGLGHRRLAILDLSSAGDQPMTSTDGRYVLTYNGEIYNYKELRTELKKIGFDFVSESDTEVLLYAIIAWGVKAIPKLNGMFAFAFWDKHKQELILARDRYGIKPLYYSCINGTLAFGSEQKALLAQPGFARRINKEALIEYFTFQNIFTDKTLLDGIALFPPGHYGIVNLCKTQNKLHITQYWDYDFREPISKVEKLAYEEELNRLFLQAVNRQLVSDVELGCYLSGGMDSGSITAIAAKSHPYLKTFTCGFDLTSASGLELGFDERNKAEYMSYCFKTEHYEMVLKSGDMERVLPKLTWHLEEPRVGQCYPNYYAAQLASKFVKVVLSGAGGDELFGGYPWRYYRAVVNNDFEHYIDNYYKFWQRLIPNTQLKQVFAPIWNEVSHVWTRDIFRNVFKHHADSLFSPEDYINHSLYFEAKTFLHGLLIVEDKLSMAHGLESRVPFLDNDLVDFAMRCPVSLKLNDLDKVVRINENEASGKHARYFEQTRDGKQILRDVMSKYIPSDVARAIKQGFSAPDASWFKGESIDFVRHALLNDKALIYEFFDRKATNALIEEHLSGKDNRRLLIWSLLNFEQVLTWVH